MRTKCGIIGIREKCEILWDPKCGMFGMNPKCVILGMKPPCPAMFRIRSQCYPWERMAGCFKKNLDFHLCTSFHYREGFMFVLLNNVIFL